MLAERYAAATASGAAEVEAVRDFARFLGRPAEEPARGMGDDVDVRAYVLGLRADGASPAEIERRLAALRRFYAWTAAEGLIERNPFVHFHLERPVLTADQVRRREERLAGDPGERELARLRALHRLGEVLNRTNDAGSALSASLRELGSVLDLPTGWAFVHSESGLVSTLSGPLPPHGFATASAAFLPPALEADGRRYLTAPPACYCQELFRSGGLTRAVNVVECTRLRAAAHAAGDTRGLLFHATLPLVAGSRPLGILNLATEEWQLLAGADLELLS